MAKRRKGGGTLGDILFDAEHLEACVLALEALRCGEWPLNARHLLSHEEEAERIQDLHRVLGMRAAELSVTVRRGLGALSKRAPVPKAPPSANTGAGTLHVARPGGLA